MEKLQRLKALYDDGVLTEDEYNRRKNDIIDSMLNSGDGGDGGAQHESPRHNANPTRGTAASPRAPEQSRSTGASSVRSAAPPGGRVVVVANAPPPGAGRVVYVDVNAHGVLPAAAKPVQVDKEGRLICFRCGEPITTKVCEWEHQPCDAVCFRLVQVGVEDLKMPNTALPEPAPVRTYKNRKGEAELAAIAKKNAEFEKKHRKFENNAAAKLEKAKEERRKQLEREAARKK